MLATFDWQSAVLGALGLIVLVGAVLAALGQIGRSWQWVMQRFRPAPPRIDLESSGGSHGSERNEATGETTWRDVRPGFKVRNDEPVPVYAVVGGIVDPGSGDRIAHPGRIPVLKAEAEADFGSSASFEIPPAWLPPFGDLNPHRAVPYYVQLIDSRDRKWEGIIDFGEDAPRLRFRRVKK